MGMLLYLVKHSCPDIANPTQELSKCLSKPVKEYDQELPCIIIYLKKIHRLGLRLRLNGTFTFLGDSSLSSSKTLIWYLKAYCDASYTSDFSKYLSVAGCLVFFWRFGFAEKQVVTNPNLELNWSRVYCYPWCYQRDHMLEKYLSKFRHYYWLTCNSPSGQYGRNLSSKERRQLCAHKTCWHQLSFCPTIM